MLLTDDARPGRPRAQSVDPGPRAGHALRAHRGRLQLPALQHPGRARPRPALPSRRDDRAADARWRERYRVLLADQPGRADPRRRRRRARTTAGSPRSWWTRDRPAGRPPTLSAALDGRGHRDPRRSGSRCTCSRSSPALAGFIDGTSERLFDHGLTLPSGLGLTDDAVRARHRVISAAWWRRDDAAVRPRQARDRPRRRASRPRSHAARPAWSRSLVRRQARLARPLPAGPPGPGRRLFETGQVPDDASSRIPSAA